MRYFVGLLFCCVSAFALANKPLPDAPATTPIDVESLALQKSYLQTVGCRAPEQLTHLLEQSLHDTDDLTAKGNNASVFEEVMMNNPACFIQAANQLSQEMCSQVAEHFIQETFFYPRRDVKHALSSAKNYQRSCIAG